MNKGEISGVKLELRLPLNSTQHISYRIPIHAGCIFHYLSLRKVIHHISAVSTFLSAAFHYLIDSLHDRARRPYQVRNFEQSVGSPSLTLSTFSPAADGLFQDRLKGNISLPLTSTVHSLSTSPIKKCFMELRWHPTNTCPV
jgi:hypothetical protein